MNIEGEGMAADDFNRLNQLLGLAAARALDWLHVQHVSMGLATKDMLPVGWIELYLGEGKRYRYWFTLHQVRSVPDLERLIDVMAEEYATALRKVEP